MQVVFLDKVRSWQSSMWDTVWILNKRALGGQAAEGGWRSDSASICCSEIVLLRQNNWTSKYIGNHNFVLNVILLTLSTFCIFSNLQFGFFFISFKLRLELFKIHFNVLLLRPKLKRNPQTENLLTGLWIRKERSRIS